MSNTLKLTNGFTLAELLICLLIIGEITTFTIPKLIYSQQGQRNNAVVKEAVGMVTGAFQRAQMNGEIVAGSSMATLTPYMNYIKTDTASIIDSYQTDPDFQCSATFPCLKLHSGAVLGYGAPPTYSFTTTASTSWVWLQVDPDGVYSGTTDGPGKAVYFKLYANGRVINSTVSSWNPPWFSW